MWMPLLMLVQLSNCGGCSTAGNCCLAGGVHYCTCLQPGALLSSKQFACSTGSISRQNQLTGSQKPLSVAESQQAGNRQQETWVYLPGLSKTPKHKLLGDTHLSAVQESCSVHRSS